MSRLGLPAEEFRELADNPGHLAGIDVRCVISHLACADDPDHPLNVEQRETFERLTAALPALPRGLANSSGIFLGPEYHYDLVRPGVALYGGNPTPGKPNPMAEVIRLQGRIVQVREIDSPVTVGYGATHRAPGPMRIATVPVGYADGYLRCLGNRANGYIGHHRVPVVGRVSMDLITLDVTGVPPRECQPGCLVDLIGGRVSIDQVAEWADTISYEIMTSLGSRYHRVYRDGDA
jgi:alanine racemase